MALEPLLHHDLELWVLLFQGWEIILNELPESSNVKQQLRIQAEYPNYVTLILQCRKSS